MNEKISVTSLAASSSGNSYYLKCGTTEILIDAGISAKSICDKLHDLGTDIANISAIFITHEHIDHVKGLAVLSKKSNVPIHMTTPSAIEYTFKYPETKNIVEHDVNYCCKVGNLTVTSFFSSHDSCACVGYTFESANDKFGIATDMGYIDKAAVNALRNCRSVVLESNYDGKMLENGCYPLSLKDRIRSDFGHLSNYDCAAFARFLAEQGTKNFMLGHLSDENNTPEIAFNITSRALAGFENVTLKVASKKEITFFI